MHARFRGLFDDFFDFIGAAAAISVGRPPADYLAGLNRSLRASRPRASAGFVRFEEMGCRLELGKVSDHPAGEAEISPIAVDCRAPLHNVTDVRRSMKMQGYHRGVKAAASMQSITPQDQKHRMT